MMSHSMMNNSIDHSIMDHSKMNHSIMQDHSSMDHSKHAHDVHDHSVHKGHSDPAVDHSEHNMDMKMYFHTGVMEYVLFESCMTTNAGQMTGACIIIFIVAVLYEGLKFLREALLQKSLAEDRPHAYVETDTGGGGDGDQGITVKTVSAWTASHHMLSCAHFIQTGLHMLQVFVSYCLMLVFMTYNIWLCLAVVLGAGCGYFLFGWKRAVVVDSNEHCH